MAKGAKNAGVPQNAMSLQDMQTRLRKSALVDSIGSGLASVVASFNPRVGNVLPQQIMESYQKRNDSRLAERTALQKAFGGDPTDKMRNYNFYVRDETAAGRKPLSFYEWESSLARSGAGSDPYSGSIMGLLMPILKDKFSKMNPSMTSPNGSNMTPANGVFDYVDPETGIKVKFGGQ